MPPAALPGRCVGRGGPQGPDRAERATGPVRSVGCQLVVRQRMPAAMWREEPQGRGIWLIALASQPHFEVVHVEPSVGEIASILSSSMLVSRANALVEKLPVEGVEEAFTARGKSVPPGIDRAGDGEAIGEGHGGAFRQDQERQASPSFLCRRTSSDRRRAPRLAWFASSQFTGAAAPYRRGEGDRARRRQARP